MASCSVFFGAISMASIKKSVKRRKEKETEFIAYELEETMNKMVDKKKQKVSHEESDDDEEFEKA